MNGLRLAHRLFAVTAFIAGAVTIHAEFTGQPMPHRAAWVWLLTTVGVAVTYRRMKNLVRRSNETPEENR